MKPNKKRKGFTLLEILLVIAAIGILAAIVLVAINPTRQIAQVRNAQRRSDINAIYKALEQYLIDNQTYPIGITESKQDICDTGTEQVGGSTDCTGKADLRVLVPIYLAAIPKDPSGGIYRAYINSDNNRIAVEARFRELGQKIAINAILCPDKYIEVPGNSLYGTDDFCVMKYEAKTGSSTVAATTQAAGNPIANIVQLDAIAACSQNINDEGNRTYGLINNNEWMTIARNIEAQPSNWRNGIIGSADASGGGLWRGHSDNDPPNALAASTDDNPYFNTNDSGTSRERRTHTLSNGEIIWDFSGNLWEYTDNGIAGEDKPNNASGGADTEWTAYTNFGTLSYDLLRPSNNTWNSTQNIGGYIAGATSNAGYPVGFYWVFLRGGEFNSGSTAGIFALGLFTGPNGGSSGIGFRCVVR